MSKSTIFNLKSGEKPKQSNPIAKFIESEWGSHHNNTQKHAYAPPYERRHSVENETFAHYIDRMQKIVEKTNNDKDKNNENKAHKNELCEWCQELPGHIKCTQCNVQLCTDDDELIHRGVVGHERKQIRKLLKDVVADLTGNTQKQPENRHQDTTNKKHQTVISHQQHANENSAGNEKVVAHVTNVQTRFQHPAARRSDAFEREHVLNNSFIQLPEASHFAPDDTSKDDQIKIVSETTNHEKITTVTNLIAEMRTKLENIGLRQQRCLELARVREASSSRDYNFSGWDEQLISSHSSNQHSRANLYTPSSTHTAVDPFSFHDSSNASVTERLSIGNWLSRSASTDDISQCSPKRLGVIEMTNDEFEAEILRLEERQHQLRTFSPSQSSSNSFVKSETDDISSSDDDSWSSSSVSASSAISAASSPNSTVSNKPITSFKMSLGTCATRRNKNDQQSLGISTSARTAAHKRLWLKHNGEPFQRIVNLSSGQVQYLV